MLLVKVAIKIENKVFEFGRIDRLRCEWTNRFGLVGAEGPKCMGCKINILPPAKITLKSFKDAVAEAKKLEFGERFNWGLTLERCLCACPVKGSKDFDVVKKVAR